MANDVHACLGKWDGHVRLATCNLCAEGWRACSWRDTELLSQLTVLEAVQSKGCFAIDAANSNGTCGPCLDAREAHLTQEQSSLSMAGFGNGCPYQTQFESSCFSEGRVDASHHLVGGRPQGTPPPCHFQPGVTNGVLCCPDKDHGKSRPFLSFSVDNINFQTRHHINFICMYM